MSQLLWSCGVSLVLWPGSVFISCEITVFLRSKRNTEDETALAYLPFFLFPICQAAELFHSGVRMAHFVFFSVVKVIGRGHLPETVEVLKEHPELKVRVGAGVGMLGVCFLTVQESRVMLLGKIDNSLTDSTCCTSSNAPAARASIRSRFCSFLAPPRGTARCRPS